MRCMKATSVFDSSLDDGVFSLFWLCLVMVLQCAVWVSSCVITDYNGWTLQGRKKYCNLYIFISFVLVSETYVSREMGFDEDVWLKEMRADQTMIHASCADSKMPPDIDVASLWTWKDTVIEKWVFTAGNLSWTWHWNTEKAWSIMCLWSEHVNILISVEHNNERHIRSYLLCEHNSHLNLIRHSKTNSQCPARNWLQWNTGFISYSETFLKGSA